MFFKKKSKPVTNTKLDISEDRQKAVEANDKLVETLRPEYEARKKYSTVYAKVPNICIAAVSKYIEPQSRIFQWVLGNYIVPELEKMSFQEMEMILDAYTKSEKISKIGSIILNEETVKEWALSYKKLNTKLYEDDKNNSQKIETERELNRKRRNLMEQMRESEAKRMAEEAKEREILIANTKKKKIDNYIDYFKTLNKAQQENELEWFKKKIITTMVDSDDEADELIHKLEMIHLAD